MAVAWPAALPAPQRSGLRIVPTPDAKARLTQSGRKEVRRWGKGGGDTITCSLRLWSDHPDHGDQVATFKRFWDRDLNFGLNWIDADWLETGLGYSGYYLRIIGYSPLQARGTIYSDYSVTFSVKPMSALWADTAWPAGSLAQGPYDFGAAAVWVVTDLPQTGCSTYWTSTTAYWTARNISAAQIKAFKSSSSNGALVCKTASPPYASVLRGSSSSYNYLGLNTSSAAIVTTVGNKSLHFYFTIPVATSLSFCFFLSNDASSPPVVAASATWRLLGIKISASAIDVHGLGTMAQVLSSIPRTSLQNHDGVANQYIVSVLYHHESRTVKVFVEGIEVFSGTATNQAVAFNQLWVCPLYQSVVQARLHGLIVENAYDERSVQAAIDFFNTL